jgi:hypothetical protein
VIKTQHKGRVVGGRNGGKENITYYFDKEKFGQLQLNPERNRHNPIMPLLFCPYVPRLPIVLFVYD